MNTLSELLGAFGFVADDEDKAEKFIAWAVSAGASAALAKAKPADRPALEAALKRCEIPAPRVAVAPDDLFPFVQGVLQAKARALGLGRKFQVTGAKSRQDLIGRFAAVSRQSAAAIEPQVIAAAEAARQAVEGLSF